LSAPLAEEADGGIQIYNNLQLTDKSDSTPVNHSYFVNGHLDSSIDWIDTLDAVPQIPYDQTVPMFYGDDIIFVHGSKLISVKKSDGTINWSSEKNTGYNSKIVNKNGQHFVIDNFKGLEKFNPSTGKTIWHKNQILELNYDFELNDNKIVYSSSQFGVLVIRDGSSGDRIFKVDCITNFVENILEQAANPKYHVASKTFISHRDNEIFAFTIEDDN